MKKTHKHEEENHQRHEIEILKAVAQAWHGHSSSSKNTMDTSEFDARRRYFKNKPSRFKLEAMMNLKTNRQDRSWDFGQSLWDSYEIVAVSKRLETGLGMESPVLALDHEMENSVKNNKKKKRESKNSLRSLFNKTSSKRFTED